MTFRDELECPREVRSLAGVPQSLPGVFETARDRASRSSSLRIGLMARALVQTTIPHSNQQELHFQRRNGSLRLTIVGHPDHGLPYGKTPRLLLAWMAQKAKQAGSRRIELPTTQAALFRDLGRQMSGGSNGSIWNFRDQALRLMKCTIHIDRQADNETVWQPYQLSSGIRLWWDRDRASALDSSCWIELTQGFYTEVVSQAVPLDFGVLLALRAPLAIDIYAWATDRVYRLRQPLSLEWSVLKGQFGAQYGRLAHFREGFERSLGQVLHHWPDLRMTTNRRGIRLQPCRPHVKPITNKKKPFLAG